MPSSITITKWQKSSLVRRGIAGLMMGATYGLDIKGQMVEPIEQVGVAVDDVKLVVEVAEASDGLLGEFVLELGG